VSRLTASHLQFIPKSETSGGTVETDTCAKNLPKIRIVQHTLTGGLWFAAWLFTIGYLHLSFWRGVFAIIVWPYYIGLHFSAVMR
jgi:hypothetical protein